MYTILIIFWVAGSRQCITGDTAGRGFAIERRFLKRFQLHLIVMNPQIRRLDIRLLIRIFHIPTDY